MREIAKRSAAERQDLFRETATRLQVHPAITEKDFWVCWMLDYLFHESPWKEHLAFKGGTSLSKAYGAIERFSEDIDLVLDWRVLGYEKNEPWLQRSVSRQNVFCKEATRRTVLFLQQEIAPRLQEELQDRLGETIVIKADGENVLIHYPKAFALDAVQPQLRLEIGPMAAWIPSTECEIRPFAAAHFPTAFSHAVTRIRTIDATRTFWEKVTILHQEAHRTPDKLLPQRYSRHYYDVHRLSLRPIATDALQQLELLSDVVEFKMRFYRCPWANYEGAKPGSLRLLPPTDKVTFLSQDYRKMKSMLFGQVPTFDQIIAGLQQLEIKINQL
jgi:hypothetical protein